MKRFALALALVLALCGVAVADGFSPIGTWSYRGNGTFTGFVGADWRTLGVGDAGTCVASGTIADGAGTITSASFVGAFTMVATGQVAPYNYPWTGSAEFKNNKFYVTINGVIYEFTMTSNDTMSITATGKQSDTKLNVSMRYTATRTTATPTSATAPSSGGGGCSVGFSPLLVLLALPLLTRK